MKIKNIIFDFDGVLVENSELLLKIHRDTLGWISDEEHLQVFDGNTPEFIKQYTKEEINLFWEKWKKVLLNEKIEEKAKTFLENNLDKNFFIISSNSEDILNKILKNEEKINLEESIFITDSLGDLRESSEFPELKKIAVTFGVHDRERLEKGKPDFIIDDWDEIQF